MPDCFIDFATCAELIDALYLADRHYNFASEGTISTVAVTLQPGEFLTPVPPVEDFSYVKSCKVNGRPIEVIQVERVLELATLSRQICIVYSNEYIGIYPPVTSQTQMQITFCYVPAASFATNKTTPDIYNVFLTNLVLSMFYASRGDAAQFSQYLKKAVEVIPLKNKNFSNFTEKNKPASFEKPWTKHKKTQLDGDEK
jgi:hypothetical protein